MLVKNSQQVVYSFFYISYIVSRKKGLLYSRELNIPEFGIVPQSLYSGTDREYKKAKVRVKNGLELLIGEGICK